MHLEKRDVCKLVLGLILVCWTGSVSAQDNKNKLGFTGYIQPVVSVARTKSIASVGDDNKRIESLDQKAKAETTFVPMVMCNMAYTFADGAARVWTGSSGDSMADSSSFLELGASYTMADDTTLILAYTPPLIDNDVWKDPFLVGKNRTETNQSEQAFRLGVESVLGTPFSVSYSFAIQDVDNERAGHSLLGTSLSAGDLEALKRSGNRHQSNIRYNISLGGGVSLQPEIYYLRGDVDGAANRFDGYGGELALTYATGKMVWMASMAMGKGEYDEVHPVFDKTREDSIYAFSLGMEYQAPFGWESLAVTLFSAYNRQNSNINFYEESACVGGLGLTRSF